MTEPMALTHAISAQVRRHRLAKNWSVRRLAEECERLGLPALNEASLGNIERGGLRGPRRVTVDELVVLARALSVQPIFLVFPVETATEIEVMPGAVWPIWDALRWFAGEMTLDDQAGQAGLMARVREHLQLVDELDAAHARAANHRATAEQWRAVEPARAAALEDTAREAERSIQLVETSLYSVRRMLRREIAALPPLPDRYAHIDREDQGDHG